MQKELTVISAKQITGTAEQKADKVKKLFADVMIGFANACKIYVDLIDDDPTVKEACIEVGIPAPFLKKAEDVGRGLLHHRLLIASGVQYHKLAKCSLSDQEKYLSSPIPVLCANGDVLNVAIDNLTKEQVEQVFSYDRVKSIPEQKAYLESLKTVKEVETAKSKTSAPYKITKYGLENITVSRLSKAELFAIVQKLP
jgi:uncharacterized protein YjhX (UPF0386 family)